jgi:hypothetical protein
VGTPVESLLSGADRPRAGYHGDRWPRAAHEEERILPQRHSEDLPWNDVAADSDTMSADPEPDPAEVAGDEDDETELDLAAHRVPDPYEKYRQETLDQRLAEEEPEASLHGVEDPEAGQLQAAESAGGDADLAEEDPDTTEEVADEDAEDAAIHIRRRV